MRIDTHHHFYLLNGLNPIDNWKKRTDLGKSDHKLDLSILYTDYGPQQLAPLIKKAGIDQSILVNMSNNPKETEEMSRWFKENPFIAGIVVHVDMQLDEQSFIQAVQDVSSRPGFVGIRINMVEFMKKSEFSEHFTTNLHYLEQQQIPIDLAVRPAHLELLILLLKAHPNLRASIVHGGKPNIHFDDFARWQELIYPLGAFPNVVTKVSGLINNLQSNNEWHQNWLQEDITPYVRYLLEVFGVDRVMFGSDWPICEVAGGYQKAYESISHGLPEQMSATDQEKLFGGNASRFYGLE